MEVATQPRWSARQLRSRQRQLSSRQNREPRGGYPLAAIAIGVFLVWAADGLPWSFAAPEHATTGCRPKPFGQMAGRVSMKGGVDPGMGPILLGPDKDIPRATPFNFGLWDEHCKNPERFVDLLKGLLLGCTQINRLRWPLWVIVLMSTAIVIYDQIAVHHLPAFFSPWNLALTPFTLSSPALGLLLVFRVNGSYGRYTEARILWGDIVNRSRDMMNSSFNWFQDESQIRKFLGWVALYPAALMCHLRRPGEHDLKTELDRQLAGGDHGLDEADVQSVVDNNMGIPAPLFIANKMRQLCWNGGVPDQEKRLIMEQHITQLVADVGATERVLNTPIPVPYTIHTARFLLIWLTLLPLSLVKDLGWATIPATYFLTYGLLGIEDVGIMLEEPFLVLPLEAVCARIGGESMAWRKASHAREASSAGKGPTTQQATELKQAYEKAKGDYKALSELQNKVGQLKAAYKQGLQG